MKVGDEFIEKDGSYWIVDRLFVAPVSHKGQFWLKGHSKIDSNITITRQLDHKEIWTSYEDDVLRSFDDYETYLKRYRHYQKNEMYFRCVVLPFVLYIGATAGLLALLVALL